MELMRYDIFLRIVIFQSFMQWTVLCIQKREWTDSPTAESTEGDVACFSEYMEKRIHSAMSEELGAWLSDALHSRVNLLSLDHLNLRLSACGFSLHKDVDSSFVFRVGYSGCLVQQQHGYYVLTLNMMRRMSRYGGRPHSLLMKCPVVSALPSREQIQCDPEFIQVTRQVPYDNWDNELQWSLSLSDHLVVALEDASLIQMSADLSGPNITLQGRREEVMSPVTVMEDGAVEFLALKLISGQYAYSMEATCPKVTRATEEETVLHILKRHMGLTKRGSRDNGALTVSEVSVQQTDSFTVHETSEFVTLIVPTAQILQTKACTESKQLLQPFYRVDVVLSFKETNHKMHWSMENTLPCAGVNFTSALPLVRQSDRAPFDEEDELARARTQQPALPPDADEMSASQSGNLSDGDTITRVNATEASLSDFLNTTANASPESSAVEASATAQSPETSAELPHLENQQLNTTGGQRQKWRWLQWEWE